MAPLHGLVQRKAFQVDVVLGGRLDAGVPENQLQVAERHPALGRARAEGPPQVVQAEGGHAGPPPSRREDLDRLPPCDGPVPGVGARRRQHT